MKLEDPGKQALLAWGLSLALAVGALAAAFIMDNDHASQTADSARAASIQR